MTQATPTIGANKSGIEYRTEDNDGKTALLNHHKGSSAPSYAEAGMLWLDDSATPWLLKMHDGSDWITTGSVNASTNAFTPYIAGAALAFDGLSPMTTAGDIIYGASSGAGTRLAGNTAATKKVLVSEGSGSAAQAPSWALTVGTSANNIVQLDGSAKLPAVDGSQLTGISGGYTGGGFTAQYFTGLGCRLATTNQLSQSANRLYFMPFTSFSTATFTRIGVNCTTLSSGKNARLGIYNAADGVPTSLVLDAGTVSFTTTGLKEITISQQLSPKLYFLAIVFEDATARISGYATSLEGGLANIMGSQDPTTGVHNLYCYHSHTYGALPANASTVTIQDNSLNMPAIWLRKV